MKTVHLSIYCKKAVARSSWYENQCTMLLPQKIKCRKKLFPHIACKWDTHLIFFHLGWYIGWKSDHISQFKENSSSNHYGTGTFDIEMKSVSSCSQDVFVASNHDHYSVSAECFGWEWRRWTKDDGHLVAGVCQWLS